MPSGRPAGHRAGRGAPGREPGLRAGRGRPGRVHRVLYLVRERSPEAVGLLRRAIDLVERAAREAPGDSTSRGSTGTTWPATLRCSAASRRRRGRADGPPPTGPPGPRGAGEGQARGWDFRFNLADTDLDDRPAPPRDRAARPGPRVVPEGHRGRRADRARGPARDHVQGGAGREPERAGRAARRSRGTRPGPWSASATPSRSWRASPAATPRSPGIRRDWSLGLDNLGNIQRDLGPARRGESGPTRSRSVSSTSWRAPTPTGSS